MSGLGGLRAFAVGPLLSPICAFRSANCNGRSTSRRVIPACKTQADRAKTRRDIKRSPDFEAYDRAERKKSRNFALRAAVENVASSFRTVCKTFGTALFARKWGTFERADEPARASKRTNPRGHAARVPYNNLTRQRTVLRVTISTQNRRCAGGRHLRDVFA